MDGLTKNKIYIKFKNKAAEMIIYPLLYFFYVFIQFLIYRLVYNLRLCIFFQDLKM